MARRNGTRNELAITPVFDAPRENVWKAWTDPEQVKQWWGPQGFTAPIIQIDLRVGGKYLYCIRSPEGKDYYGNDRRRDIQGTEREDRVHLAAYRHARRPECRSCQARLEPIIRKA